MPNFDNNKIIYINKKSTPETQVIQTDLQILSIADQYNISNEEILVFYSLNHKFSFIYPYARKFMIGIQFEQEQLLLIQRENLNDKDIFIIKSLLKTLSELKKDKNNENITLMKDVMIILENTLISKYLFGEIENQENILKILYGEDYISNIKSYHNK